MSSFKNAITAEQPHNKLIEVITFGMIDLIFKSVDYFYSQKYDILYNMKVIKTFADIVMNTRFYLVNLNA